MSHTTVPSLLGMMADLIALLHPDLAGAARSIARDPVFPPAGPGGFEP